ncbi:MAG: ribbon-helix-helix domain-containing protein [Azonexus sp.]|jgi:predicted transcriptional regulator|nr:ribbon-helix-helix domain-containing protein [Azonexus sp.]
MSTLTIRLPDNTTERLKTLARSRGLSVNKLVEEMSTQALAAFDVELRFKTLAASGDNAQALAILDRLDAESPATH